MRLILSILTIIILSVAPSLAKAETITHAFDAICVSSQLEETSLKHSAAAYAKHFNLKIIDAPAEALSVLNPFAKYGWVMGGGQSLVINYGEKTVDGRLSKSCNIASPDGDRSDVESFIRDRYSAKKILEQVQGSNLIIVYKPELIGFKEGLYIAIQEKDKSMTEEKLISISLYDGGNK